MVQQPSIIEQPFVREEDVNNYAFDELIRAIKDRTVFAFVGAGCSKRLGYPSWEELIDFLEAQVRTVKTSVRLEDYKGFLKDNTDDKLWYAEILKSNLVEEFYGLIQETYKQREIRDWSFHQSLLSINFRHYLTTNYDPLLENTRLITSGSLNYFSWNNKERLKTFFEAIHSSSDEDRSVFHIHGRFDDKESIILTEKDYLGMYHQEELAVKVLWSIIASYRMCFIGFGLKDLDVLTVFRKVWWDFGRGNARHFAFIKENDKTKRIIFRQYMRDKYGINPIFFNKLDGADDEYIELKQRVDDLATNRTSKTDIESDIGQVNEINDLNLGLKNVYY